MTAWPQNSKNNRVAVASQGKVGSYLTIPGYGTYVRLNASGLSLNTYWNEGDTPSPTWALFWVVEIWVYKDNKDEPIRPNAKFFYLHWNPEEGWFQYQSKYTINIGKINDLYVGTNLVSTFNFFGTTFTNRPVNSEVPSIPNPNGNNLSGPTTTTNIDAYGITTTASFFSGSETNQNIKNAIRTALLNKGYSLKETNDFLVNLKFTSASAGNAANSNIGITGGGGGGGGSSYVYIPYGTVEKPVLTKIVTVRLGRSYEAPRTLSPLFSGKEDTYPQMIQYLANQPVRSAEDLNRGIPRNSNTAASSNFSSLKFVFPYIPSDVQYSSLSSTWAEIPRGYNYPFLDWSAFQRMKVSFSLIIASTRIEPGNAIVPDGVINSVDEQLNLLRMMFQTKQPITIYNMDSLLTNTNDALSKKPTQFVMTDLTIEGIRRQEKPPQHITTAQVNITLLEIVVEEAQILNIEPPSFDEIVPRRTTTTNVPTGPDLWTLTFQPSINGTLVLPTGIG